MKTSLFAVCSNGQNCADCAVRELSVCSSLDEAEMHDFEQLSRRVHFSACETVFAQEDMSLPLFSLVDRVIRLYKLLPDGRGQIVGFALPGDLLGMTTADRHGVSADAIGAVAVCRFARVPFAAFLQITSTCCAGSMSWSFGSSIGLGTIWSCSGGDRRRRRSQPFWSIGGTFWPNYGRPQM